MSKEVKLYRASLGETYYERIKSLREAGGNTMKYNSSNAPLKCMMTNSTCF